MVETSALATWFDRICFWTADHSTDQRFDRVHVVSPVSAVFDGKYKYFPRRKQKTGVEMAPRGIRTPLVLLAVCRKVSAAPRLVRESGNDGLIDRVFTPTTGVFYAHASEWSANINYKVDSVVSRTPGGVLYLARSANAFARRPSPATTPIFAPSPPRRANSL